MSEVKRHSVSGYGRQDICYNDPEGEFVYHEDYATLKAERDALATENAALKAAIAKYAKVKQDFDDFDGDRRGIAACLCEAEDALVDGIKTPATDAYLNSVRAEGVDMVKAHPAISLCSLSHVCEEIANQLRAGKEPS